MIAIGGIFVGQPNIQSEITSQVTATLGTETSDIINSVIDNMARPNQGIIASIIGVGVLLFGAINLFRNLQTALDRIWDVSPPEDINFIEGFIKDNLLSFGMVLVIGFLLLVSFVIGTALSILDNYLLSLLPWAEALLRLFNFILTFSITTILFMFIYKFLPHAEIQWRDVTIGGAVTAALFTLGQTVLVWYLSNSAISSSYGAAGSFVVLLVWIYYSAQLVLFGAEFTQVFAKRYGSFIDDNQV